MPTTHHRDMRVLHNCFVAFLIFYQVACAQGAIDPTLERWARANNFVGTSTWNASGNGTQGAVTQSFTLSSNWTLALEGGAPVYAAIGGTDSPFPPAGKVSVNLQLTVDTTTKCFQPGRTATVHAVLSSSNKFDYVILTLIDAALPTNPTKVAAYSLEASASLSGLVTDTDCNGNVTTKTVTSYILLTSTADFGTTIIYAALPLTGNTLSGSATVKGVPNITPFLVNGNGTFSWNLVADPSRDKDTTDCTTQVPGNSTIECENQTLREDIPVVGTPLTLTYSSDRVPGRTNGNQVAQKHTALLGGWNFSSQHRYNKDAVCILLGGGGRLSSVVLGSISPAASGAYQIASADGREVYVFAGTDGRHLKTRDTLTGADLLTYGYDSAQRLVSITDVIGNVTKIERDAAGRMTAVVSPFGQRTTIASDANGYIASVTNSNGEVRRMTYTTGGLMTSMTNPRGFKTSFSYDAEGRLLRADNSAGGFLKLSKVSNPDQSFDVTLTSALGRTTKYHTLPFATGGEKRTITSPANLVSTIERDGSNNTTGTAPDGMKTIQQLGDDPRFGRAASFVRNSNITSPAGLKLATIGNRSVSLATPSDPFSLTSVTDATFVNGRIYASKYDAATKTFTDTTPQGRQSKVTLDAKGRVVSLQTAGLFPVQYTYDARGRVSTVTAGLGTTLRTTTFAYDASSYLSSIADTIGRRVSFTRDAVGRVKQQALPDGRVIAFAYDQHGNLTGLTPPGRPEHKFTYNQLDQTAEYLPPAVGLPLSTTTYSYNLDRDPTAIAHPDGKMIGMTYDTAGRMSDITLARGALHYAYNSSTGNLSTVDSPDSIRLTYAYDGSFPISETWSGAVAGTLRRKFDNNFRVTQTQVNAETPLANSYDLDGLLIKAGALTLSRNAQNGLLIGSKLGVVSDSWTYNGFGEPLSYRASTAAATLYDTQFNRDALGRITTKIETVAGVRTIFAYAYDLAGRLSEVKRNGIVTSKYTYDANGNRLTHTFPSGTESGTYDDQDRLLSYGNATYTYTANGELETKKVGNQITTYDYDELGNLIGVALPDGKKITYVIDGASRRAGKKINGVVVQEFLYDGALRPIAEMDGAGRVVSRFVYATRTNVPDYVVRDGAMYRVETDHLGSPRLLVAAATGAIAHRIEYDEFGNVLADSNPGFQPFGFAGGLADRDTNLVRFGARDYDAKIGRWLSKDASMFVGRESNLYSYASQNPVSLSDATGNYAVIPPVAGAPPPIWVQFQAEIEFAVQYWGNRYERGSLTAGVLGSLAALALPNVADRTATVLGCGFNLGHYARRPYWQYYPKSNPGYDSKWMTRGPYWDPPYATGAEAAGKLSLPPYNPGDAVRPVSPNTFDYVAGPRNVAPQFGQSGGGTESRIGGWQ